MQLGTEGLVKNKYNFTNGFYRITPNKNIYIKFDGFEAILEAVQEENPFNPKVAEGNDKNNQDDEDDKNNNVNDDDGEDDDKNNNNDNNDNDNVDNEDENDEDKTD